MQPRGQFSGIFDIPDRVLGVLSGDRTPFAGNVGGGNGERGPVTAGGQQEGPEGEGQGVGPQGAGVEGQQGNPNQEQNQGQQQQQGQEPQSCIRAAAKCNSNIICGTALRKQLPTCQNPIFPKRCFKCQMATSVLRATPEGQEYMNCECGIDLACRLRRRLQASCLGGQ